MCDTHDVIYNVETFINFVVTCSCIYAVAHSIQLSYEGLRFGGLSGSVGLQFYSASCENPF